MWHCRKLSVYSNEALFAGAGWVMRFLYVMLALLSGLLTNAAVGDEPARRVVHPFGEALIEGQPARVVSLYQGATDTALALGVTPIGVVESWVERPMYHYLRDALPETVRYLGLETQPDLEGVAGLRPDLIIGADYRHELVYPLLSRMAPTVIVNTGLDFKALLILVGAATDREDAAQQLLTQWNARVADFKRQISAKLGDTWPQRVAIVSVRADHVRLYYHGFAASILAELGFSLPEKQGRGSWGIKLSSREGIPALESDVMFMFLQGAEESVAYTLAQWSQHPLWQNLTAVRNDQVFEVDPVTWNMGGGIIAANHLLDELYAHYQLDPFYPREGVRVNHP